MQDEDIDSNFSWKVYTEATLSNENRLLIIFERRKIKRVQIRLRRRVHNMMIYAHMILYNHHNVLKS